MGSMLYQIRKYDKSPEGREQMLKEMGFEPEKSKTYTFIPGVNPGKSCPVATDFLSKPDALEGTIEKETIFSEISMKEKFKIVKNYVNFVKPISWYSKSFTAQKLLKYGTLEKETLALVTSIMDFRDMIEAAPITFIITDLKPLLWALKHRESNLKISRWVLKLFELNINFIVSHTEGSRNLIADFLSRIHMVPEEITDAKHNQIGNVICQARCITASGS
jgi:hypothetical protein